MITLLQSKSLAVLGLCVLTSLASPASLPPPASKNGKEAAQDRQQFAWATIGDSWASSVAYSDDVAYDKNAGKCLRSTESYTYQLMTDESWKDWPQSASWPACSGSQLVNLALGTPEEAVTQVSQTGDNLRVLFVTSGGNNAGFAGIAINCIYHPDISHDYQGLYPNDGACKTAIQDARTKIQGSMKEDLFKTYKDIFTHYGGQQGDLDIYHTGYAHFFNVDTDWCDQTTFDAPTQYNLGFGAKSKPQYLNQQLRQEINNLVEDMNGVIQAAIIDWNINGQASQAANSTAISSPTNSTKSQKVARTPKDPLSKLPVLTPSASPTASHPTSTPASPPALAGSGVGPAAQGKRRISFLDISAGFNGHRFCEEGHQGKQFTGDDVWFWNILWKTSRAAASISTNLTLPADQQQQLKDIGVDSGSGSGNEISNGWTLRPFHPTAVGNKAIKEAMIARMRADKIPGIK